MKPKPGSRFQSDKAEDAAAGFQPLNDQAPFSQKTWYRGDYEDERSRIESAVMKMAMEKPLAFGRAGCPGIHPAQVDVM